MINVQIKGLDAALARLNNFAEDVLPAVKEAVLEGALLIENDAKLSIQHGSHTGRVYGRHQASAPGEAPATDTGLLASSISHTVSEDGLTVEVSSMLPQAADLEYGTRKMEARPFLGPAVDKNRAAIVDLVKDAVGGAE